MIRNSINVIEMILSAGYILSRHVSCGEAFFTISKEGSKSFPVTKPAARATIKRLALVENRTAPRYTTFVAA